MNWPQLTMLVLIALNVGLNLGLDGQPRRYKYSFWIACVGAAVIIFILHQGGFWS
jgi:hypothetical protein